MKLKPVEIREILYLLIVVLIFVLSSYDAVHAGPFVTVGVGAHLSEQAKPEIDLEIPLGVVEAGYTFDNNVIVKFTHISGLVQKEDGYGLNMITVNYRWEW